MFAKCLSIPSPKRGQPFSGGNHNGHAADSVVSELEHACLGIPGVDMVPDVSVLLRGCVWEGDGADGRLHVAALRGRLPSSMRSDYSGVYVHEFLRSNLVRVPNFVFLFEIPDPPFSLFLWFV